ncbi:Spy/CpxP family protein refolding chaperone [Streptomyces sp. V4I23]|nr:Spy/CpxP family protein refolding chaperone [Streptomyces sp. V4I23]
MPISHITSRLVAAAVIAGGAVALAATPASATDAYPGSNGSPGSGAVADYYEGKAPWGIAPAGDNGS